MSGNVVGKVLEHFPFTNHTAFVIAIVFADAANQDGSNMRIGVTRAARLARVCERTVQYHIQRFLKSEFLLLVQPGGGRNRPAQYCVNLNWLERQPCVLDLEKTERESVKNKPEKVHVPRRIDAATVAPIPNETMQEGCISMRTQPEPSVYNPHPSGNGNEHWDIDLPFMLQAERCDLVSAALRTGRTAAEMRAAALLATTAPGIRNPAGFAISKLRDPTWRAKDQQKKRPISAPIPTAPQNVVEGADVIRASIEALKFEEIQRYARRYNSEAGATCCKSYEDNSGTYKNACERVVFTSWLRHALRLEMGLPSNS